MKKVKIACFDREVHIYLEPDELLQALQRKYKRKIENYDMELDALYGQVRLITHNGRKIILYVNFNKNAEHKEKYFLIQTISHECYHAAVTLYESLGAENCSDLEEPIAYMTDYLVGQVLKYIDENR